MKLNHIQNGSGVVNAIQKAINELAEWWSVQQDPQVNAAMRETDGILRRALQCVRDIQDDKIPTRVTVFLLTCTNEENAFVSNHLYPELKAAQKAMHDDVKAMKKEAVLEGYSGCISATGKDYADLDFGDENEYHWRISEIEL